MWWKLFHKWFGWHYVLIDDYKVSRIYQAPNGVWLVKHGYALDYYLNHRSMYRVIELTRKV